MQINIIHGIRCFSDNIRRLHCFRAQDKHTNACKLLLCLMSHPLPCQNCDPPYACNLKLCGVVELFVVFPVLFIFTGLESVGMVLQFTITWGWDLSSYYPPLPHEVVTAGKLSPLARLADFPHPSSSFFCISSAIDFHSFSKPLECNVL